VNTSPAVLLVSEVESWTDVGDPSYHHVMAGTPS
jgi:hypothetical protein